jgi:hypothetical protein
MTPSPLRARSAQCRPLQRSRDLPAQFVGDGLLPLVTAVQIRHGRVGCRESYPVHQLTQVGARIRRELVAGMPQIVEVALVTFGTLSSAGRPAYSH